MGFWTSGLWAVGVGWAYLQPATHAALSERVRELSAPTIGCSHIINPASINIPERFQEIIVFLIVAMTLALAVRRSNALLISHAGIERERTNLARYFSPNVVEQLSGNDEPLKQVRTQNVAVLFADIVGFTAYADGRNPTEVIGTLRQFHERMEREVFRHGGTLDKYLGDGLMATFGTPFAGDSDAGNALRCAQAMIAVDRRIEPRAQGSQRAADPGQRRIALWRRSCSGDIGLNRLEFAVIGTTVNAASRLEALTREFGCAMVASDELVQQARTETEPFERRLRAAGRASRRRAIRGLEQPVGIWTRANVAS